MIEPHHLQFLGKYPWGVALMSVQDGEPLAEHDIDCLFEECSRKPILTANDHLDFCRQLFLLSTLAGERNFAPLLDKFARTSYPKSFQLPRYYLTLIYENLKKSYAITLPSIFVETQGKLPEWNMTGPQMMAELGAIALYLGIKRRDGELIRSSLKLAHLAIDTFENVGLWQEEKEYLELHHLFWHSHIFKLASFVSNYPKFQLLADSAQARIEKMPPDVITTLSPYYWLLSQIMLDVSYAEVQTDSADGDCDHLFSYEFDKLHADFTFIGCGTGVGAVRKKSVSIRTMGPSGNAMHDPRVFGIDRPATYWDPTTVQHTVEEGRFHLKGWVPTKSGNWMLLKADALRGRVLVEADFEGDQPTHFLLFAAANLATIDENFSLKPATLDRYVGPPAEIALCGGEDQIKIFPDDSIEKMQVIPLAGGNHFWGSHFLIALSPSEGCSKIAFTLV